MVIGSCLFNCADYVTFARFGAFCMTADRFSDIKNRYNYRSQKGREQKLKVWSVFSWPDKTKSRSQVVILQPDKCLKIQTKIHELATYFYNVGSRLPTPYSPPSLIHPSHTSNCRLMPPLPAQASSGILEHVFTSLYAWL